MPLSFPTNPVTGQTYQSGSSATYTYNGGIWTITAPKTSIAVNVVSASWGDQRMNVSWIAPGAAGGTLFIAEGDLYAIKSNNTTYTGYVAAQGLLTSGAVTNNTATGLENAYLIDFPNETSSALLTASVYGDSACALFDNGNLYTWGQNNTGQLGLGYQGGYLHQPTLSTTAVTKVFTNMSQNSDYASGKLLIQKSDGWVYGTGYTGFGSLGLGNAATASNITTWTQIPGIGQNPLAVFNIGGTNGGIIAQKSNGQVVACGSNNKGQLGDGSNFISPTTPYASFTTCSGWLAGDSSAVLLKAMGWTRHTTDGSTWTSDAGINIWISGNSGQKIMFAGNTSRGQSGNHLWGVYNSTTPVSASFATNSVFTDVVAVGASGSTLYAWTGSDVWSWGENTFGQTGISSSLLYTANVVPVPELRVTGVTEILHGDYTVFQKGNSIQSPIFKRTDGNYYMLGKGEAGMMGIGENPTTNRLFSLRRLNLPNSESLKYVGLLNTNAEFGTYIAVTQDDRFYAWGKNSGYATIDNASVEFFSPVIKTPLAIIK